MASHDLALPAGGSRRVSSLPAPALLGLALKVDATVSAVNGLAYVAGAQLLEGLLGLSAALLRPLGTALLAFAAGVSYVATRRLLPARWVRMVIVLNVIWVLESVLVLAAGWFTPTTAGAVWIVLQASVVAGFVGLQSWALWRSRRDEPPAKRDHDA